MIDGFAVVDKPAGMTSHDVVARCRRVFAQKKVGHAGTLDPSATGILVLGLGRATRLLRFLTGLGKAYTGEVVLGRATTSLDETGETTGTWDMGGVTLDDARRAARTLTGEIEQVPPMVSAVKVGGDRLYRLARAGVEVERAARRVTVGLFDVDGPASIEDGSPVFAIRVECSSGTYVRSLAADLGSTLGGGAHLRGLRRTRVGPWTVDEAVALGHLGPTDVIAPMEGLPWMEAVTVDDATAAAVGNGRVLPADALPSRGPGPWRVADSRGGLLAVYSGHGEGAAKPLVVLAGPAS